MSRIPINLLLPIADTTLSQCFTVTVFYQFVFLGAPVNGDLDFPWCPVLITLFD